MSLEETSQNTALAKKHNFGAGPSILPPKVLEEASKAVNELNGTGLSLIEISHRSKEFKEIMQEAQTLVRELLDVPDNYSVQFLQGGASLGFYMAAMNFMKKENGKAGYVKTGSWAKKAIKEAKKVGEVVEVASSEDKNFNYIPKNFGIPNDLDFMHFTSNNTIFGTEFHNIPTSRSDLICDMSSDIFSRPVDVSKYTLIYAGAQKNMGPAGTTLHIVNKDKLGNTERDIPSMLDYQVHDEKDSMFNTPPVFAVYTSMLMLRWIKENGGVEGMQKRNAEKAEIMYNEIDNNPMFTGVAEKDDRSYMNATFVLKDESHKEEFENMLEEAGIKGLNGHRSVGGYRASMYNALPKESVEALVDVMKEFANKKA
ncbi:MAG: 3-phosphoserine/phosphohydroxythreonine transaminase [Flavobacteriales bacterium]